MKYFSTRNKSLKFGFKDITFFVGFGWNELEFRDSENECPVCNETDNKQMKFPTNCGHWFCGRVSLWCLLLL